MKNFFSLLSLVVLIIANKNYGMNDTLSHSLQKENKDLCKTIGLLTSWGYDPAIEHANEILKKLSKEKYFPYQDILVNGTRLWRGLGTDCPSRFREISSELFRRYNRPFTVIDIGANNGYFSLRLANEHNATCVMADMTERLRDICELNTDLSDKLIYLKKQLTIQDLKELNKSVHFDVLIALHVLHHVVGWQEFTDELFKLADTVIIETPPANDPRQELKSTIPIIESALVEKNGKVIARTPRVLSGVFDNLREMKADTYVEVPTYSNIKSTMFVFGQPKNDGVLPLNVSHFKQFNMVFPNTY